ncbi:hypothetical protein NXX09_03230 [Bacteroides uniformis]|nr:hypothetical protein [Bacteroides uniformis]
MTQHNAIKLFEAKKVRTVWDDIEERWYFSIVDVVTVCCMPIHYVSDRLEKERYKRKRVFILFLFWAQK